MVPSVMTTTAPRVDQRLSTCVVSTTDRNMSIYLNRVYRNLDTVYSLSQSILKHATVPCLRHCNSSDLVSSSLFPMAGFLYLEPRVRRYYACFGRLVPASRVLPIFLTLAGGGRAEYILRHRLSIVYLHSGYQEKPVAISVSEHRPSGPLFFHALSSVAASLNKERVVVFSESDVI